jgi:hypothetical protein
MGKVERWAFILDAFGFSSLRELNESCWHISNPKIMAFTITVSSVLASVATWITKLTGFEPLMFLAFSILILIETITGIHVALKNGKKFSSRKFGRMFLKFGYYLAIVIVLNLFSQFQNYGSLLGLEIDPFSWLYNGFLVAITIQLLVSVLENLGKLGFTETNKVVKAIKVKFNKWFDLEGDHDEYGQQ